MRVKSVVATWLHVPIPEKQQHVSDFGRAAFFDCTLVRIETECGIIGWGEAKEEVGSSANNRAVTTAINEKYGPMLVGEDRPHGCARRAREAQGRAGEAGGADGGVPEGAGL